MKSQDKNMFEDAMKQATTPVQDDPPQGKTLNAGVMGGGEVVEVEAMTPGSVQSQLKKIIETVPTDVPVFSHSLLMSLKENLGFYTDHTIVNIGDFNFTLKPISQSKFGSMLKFLRFYFGPVFAVQSLTDEQLLRFRPYVIAYSLSHINNVSVESLFNTHPPLEEGEKAPDVLTKLTLKNAIVDFLHETLKPEHTKTLYKAYLEKWSYTLQIVKNKLYQCPLCGWEIAVTKDERVPKVCCMDSYELVEVKTDPLA